MTFLTKSYAAQVRYYAQREAAEWSRAAESTDPRVREIHAELAAEYAVLNSAAREQKQQCSSLGTPRRIFPTQDSILFSDLIGQLDEVGADSGARATSVPNGSPLRNKIG